MPNDLLRRANALYAQLPRYMQHAIDCEDDSGLEPDEVPDAYGERPCLRCKGTGWLEPIGPCADGSYITSRPCPDCKGLGTR